MRALLNLRYTVPERQEAFRSGLKRLGYQIIDKGDADLLVSWNRIGAINEKAKEYERTARPVLVAENAAWGNDFLGQRWYSLARGFHNTRGRYPVGGSERFDRLSAPMADWRMDGETVILPQRGIGPAGVAMPRGWGRNLSGRVRMHPGRNPSIPLEQDLAKCAKVITWGSGAAVKACMWGICVESHYPDWIGTQDNTDADRLRMLRELSWAQWTLEEIASGEAFEWLLSPA